MESNRHERADRNWPLRRENLHIAGFFARSTEGEESGELVQMDGRKIYLTETQLRSLVEIVPEILDRVDGVFSDSIIGHGGALSNDARRRRVESLASALEPAQENPPIVEHLRGQWWRFNLAPECITYDLELLRNHRLDGVPRAAERLRPP